MKASELKLLMKALNGSFRIKAFNESFQKDENLNVPGFCKMASQVIYVQ